MKRFKNFSVFDLQENVFENVAVFEYSENGTKKEFYVPVKNFELYDLCENIIKIVQAYEEMNINAVVNYVYVLYNNKREYIWERKNFMN